jgi:hypothetical protein
MARVIGKSRVEAANVIGAKEKLEALLTQPTETYTIADKYYIVMADSDGNLIKRDPTYIHSQNSTSATWVITHGLGTYPSVTAVDSGGTNVIGEVSYDSALQLTITFSGTTGFQGKAYLN